MSETESKIYKTLICGGEISLSIADTTALTGEAMRRHCLTPTATAALGRTLAATIYLCSWLKEENSALFVTIDGGGAGGKIRATGDGKLNVSGFVENPFVDLPLKANGKLDVGGFVGNRGMLSVVRDDDGAMFTGSSELVSGEIGEDFSAYFLRSEQRPTAIAVGVKVNAERVLGAGGLFLQPLPFASEESVTFAEREIQKYANLSSIIEKEGVESILKAFHAEDVEERTAKFCCRCSKERAMKAVSSLGRYDAEKLIEEEGEIRVHCNECNTDYVFSRTDLNDIFKEEQE